MANIGQTVIIRTDLGFPIGLLAAQVAHIHFEMFRQSLLDEDQTGSWEPEIEEWLKSPYLFVKKVPNELGLIHYKKLAEQAGVEVTEWRDTVCVQLSETQQQAFHDVLVGISLGPNDADKIRGVIGDLPLL